MGRSQHWKRGTEMTAWSGLYNHIHGVDYTPIGTVNAFRRLRRAVRGHSKQTRILRALMTALDGVAAGGTAATTMTLPSAETDSALLGGVRTITTSTSSRATVAADVTAINAAIAGLHTPTFPREASGNSGGGKLGF